MKEGLQNHKNITMQKLLFVKIARVMSPLPSIQIFHIDFVVYVHGITSLFLDTPNFLKASNLSNILTMDFKSYKMEKKEEKLISYEARGCKSIILDLLCIRWMDVGMNLHTSS